MKLAFYAPLKAPDHPVASGDRNIARALILALEGIGVEVQLASTLRSRDGQGDESTQQSILERAKSELPALMARGKAEGWQAWLSYHNYYKAPDLLGPAVAQALQIPYLLVEATRATKRLTGPWATFALAAEAATDAAKVVFYFTERDAEALHRDAPEGQKLIHLRPFLTKSQAPPQAPLDGPILSVGMMRHADKLPSYQIIADTLTLLPPQTWQLQIVGDGPARAEVETLMLPFGDAVTFLGALDRKTLDATYHHSSCFFWPGVNEAFGLSYLEAQAAGLPVIAQDRPGVRDVLAPGDYPLPKAGTSPLAAMIAEYTTNPKKRADTGAAAQAHVIKHHLLPAAQTTLRRGLLAAGVAL